MIGSFFVKRTGSLAFVEDVNTGSGVAYAAEVQPDTSIWHGIELDYIRVRKELTVGTTTTGPYIKTAGAAADINNNSTTVQATKVLLTTGTLLSAWRATGDLTKIDGGKIYTGSVITSALAFVPLISAGGTGAIVATINASAEGVRISGTKITIDGNVDFSSGYNPTTKVAAVGGSYDSAASGARIRIFPDANTAIQIIDNAGADVFKAMVGGTDVGDVSIGNYAGGQGILYDKSAGTTTFKGTILSSAYKSATSGERLEIIAAGAIGSDGARISFYNYLNAELGGLWGHPSGIIVLSATENNAVQMATYSGYWLRGTDSYGGFECSGKFMAQVSLNVGNSLSVTYFTVDGSGRITKVNNTAASGNTGKVLRSDGTSFTPASLALSDLTAVTASKIAVTDASGYITASAIASSELFTPAYGELYDAVSTSTISTNGTSYVKWTGTTVGNCKGVTGSTANDNLTIDAGQGGKYLIIYSVTFKADAIDDYYWAINQGGSAVSKTRMIMNATAANTQFNVCGCAIVTLSAADTIDLGCYATNGRTVTVIYANLSIQKISN